MPKWKWLPESNSWTSICMPESQLDCKYRVPAPKVRRLFGLFRCTHNNTSTFSMTDHEPGPGIYSDSYEGVVCMGCGKVMELTQVW